MGIQALPAQWETDRGGYADHGELYACRLGCDGRVTWWYEFPASFLWWSCNCAGSAGALGAGAGAVFLFVLYIAEAGQKTLVRCWFSAGRWSDQQWCVSQPGVWIYVQDSAGLGVADRGDECARRCDVGKRRSSCARSDNRGRLSPDRRLRARAAGGVFTASGGPCGGC